MPAHGPGQGDPLADKAGAGAIDALDAAPTALCELLDEFGRWRGESSDKDCHWPWFLFCRSNIDHAHMAFGDHVGEFLADVAGCAVPCPRQGK